MRPNIFHKLGHAVGIARLALCAVGWVAAGGLAFAAKAPISASVGLAAPVRLGAIAPEVPVAVAARLSKVGAATRLTFDLSRPVEVSTYVLENPDRLVIESSEINFQIDPNAVSAKSPVATLIRSYRFGQFLAGRSRIILDLEGPVRIQKVDVASVAGGDPSRLTVQLLRSDRASFHEKATSQVAPPNALADSSTSAPEVLNDTRPVIVIDPGHGGIDPGASGLDGVVEKTVVFQFATDLVDRLRASGRYKVVMTRTGDSFVSLSDRVKVARDAKAQLFVSVHADTVADGPGVAGATVYTAADRATDAEAARVAATENKADEMAGVDAAPEATDVSDILMDLTRRETRTFSHSFQRTLAGYWQKIARLNKNPERSAGFMVLKAPDVPSVLLELGYLSSEQDVAGLRSADWRAKAAGSVAASIDAFFAAQSRDQQTAGAQMETMHLDPDKSAIVVLKPHL